MSTPVDQVVAVAVGVGNTGAPSAALAARLATAATQAGWSSPEVFVVDAAWPPTYPGDAVLRAPPPGPDPGELAEALAAALGAERVDVYQVRRRLRWDDLSAPGPPGAPGSAASPIVQFSFLSPAPGSSRPAFLEHWHDVHTPLARAHHPGVARYAQLEVVARGAGAGSDRSTGGDRSAGGGEAATAGPPGGLDAVAGISELWFPTAHDRRERLFASEESARVIGEDVARFADAGAIRSITVRPAVREQTEVGLP